LHESNPDGELEIMKERHPSGRQERKTSGKKDSQNVGMKSRFHREKLPKHRLGKMSDKKMVCGNSGQGALSHLAE